MMPYRAFCIEIGPY